MNVTAGEVVLVGQLENVFEGRAVLIDDGLEFVQVESPQVQEVLADDLADLPSGEGYVIH